MNSKRLNTIHTYGAILVMSLFVLPGNAFSGSQGETWATDFNGTGNGQDKAYALAVDDSGNAYVTGKSFGSHMGFEYVTGKVDHAGNLLWVKRYVGQGWGDHEAWELTLDSEGNVYVTGHSYGYDAGDDYATIKYDLDGNELWVARYNGTGWGMDWAEALAVDDSGNVYVTGLSTGSTTGIDFATVKYDPDGSELWVARYSGPGYENDVPLALAVDGSGNVYVTGYSERTDTGNDYLTIKYDGDGNQIWEARYNGPGNDTDMALSLAVDGLGNVYVTGYSYGSGSDDDYATIKYDENGNELWVERYNGSANNRDEAQSLALDGLGNIYVTGYSYGSSTFYDYTTIKYDPAGNILWEAHYNGYASGGDYAKSIFVNDSGHVYVSGYSAVTGVDFDFATVKYDTDGYELWAARYNNVDNGDDILYALAVDGAGNAYVAGYSQRNSTFEDYTVLKYIDICTDNDGDGYGVEVSPACDHPDSDCDDTAPAVNPGVLEILSGSPVCTDSIDNDCDGGIDDTDPGCAMAAAWSSRYNGPDDDDDAAVDIAVDGFGNVYVTGRIYVGFWNSAYGTIKYDAVGNEIWTAHYNPGTLFDSAKSLAVDDSGNVYVTGYSFGSDSSYDYATVKYDASGNELWVARYDGPTSGSDQSYSLALDGLGYVYVTGYSDGDGTGNDYATIKYDENGNELWVARYNGPTNGDDEAAFLALDDLGNVYVTGRSEGIGTGNDYATIKYDTDGNELWAARYYYFYLDLNDEATSLVVDELGNVYVTGNVGGSRAFTIKYDAYGILRWGALFSRTSYGVESAEAIALDDAGNVYVSGSSERYDTGYDYRTIKYDPEGDQLWVALFNGPGNGKDEAKGLVVDGPGNVYVTGYSTGNGTGYDCTTIKYDTHGNTRWVIPYDGLDSGNDSCNALAVDEAGNVYAAGYESSTSGLTGEDYVTIKYSLQGVPCVDSDEDGYGNPASPLCTSPDLDCDDADPGVNPDAEEICDGIDNNCVNGVDEEPIASESCTNGLFCDGQEQCVSGACQDGIPINCDDGVSCTTDTCNEVTDACKNQPSDFFCDDSLWCNGSEICDPVNGCQAGSNPCAPDGNDCTDDLCNEADDSCQYPCSATGPEDPCCEDPACSSETVCGTDECIDNDGDGYGSPPDSSCPDPREDCDNDPSNDPDGCDLCNCGIAVCAGCARCINPGAQEFSGDSFDSNCNGNNDCFIATAAYGSEMKAKIHVLREFRDRVLIRNARGKTFVDLYYRCSPPVARWMERHEGFRVLVQILLAPLVGMAKLFLLIL